jgi:hypothetical protein
MSRRPIKSTMRHKKMVNAAKNRRELIAAQLSRRELIKMGLITHQGCKAAMQS